MSLKGLVEAADGTALAGVSVVLRSGVGEALKEWRTTADPSGRFEIGGLAPGRYTLLLMRGLGGIGETLRREIDIRRVSADVASQVMLLVWDERPESATEGNLWDEIKYALRTSPRDGLREEEPTAPLDADPDAPTPIIEESGRRDGQSLAQVGSADIRLSQSYALSPSSATPMPGVNAGFTYDSPAFRLATFSVAGERVRGGSLTSPMLAGSGVTDEILRLKVRIAASEVDQVQVNGALGRDSVQSAVGSDPLGQTDESTIGNLDARWRRRMPDGDLTVKLSYARGALSIAGGPVQDLSLVQSFWSVHSEYVAQAAANVMSVGGAYRFDHAPSTMAAWPGTYDETAGLIGFTGADGAATAHVRDAWRLHEKLALRTGVSVFYPVAEVERAFAEGQAGLDATLWPGSSLLTTGRYVYASPVRVEGTLVSDRLDAEPGTTTVMTELSQRFPRGAELQAFAGSRDLRALYQQAAVADTEGYLPNPLFYTTGLAIAREAGVELRSAPVGGDATIAFRYVHGRTEGALSVTPIQYLRRDLVLGESGLAPARVSYSQAVVALSVPRVGTSADVSFVQVDAIEAADRESTSGYSLWGAQVRQLLPFRGLQDARLSVLLAANQVLTDLYQLDAMSQTPRHVQMTGGVALSF